MSKQTGFLLFLLVALTVFVSWVAKVPNLYTHGPNANTGGSPYYWTYPLWMFGFGTVAISLLSLKRPLLKFVGASISFTISSVLLALFGMTTMHSPPVHVTIVYILLVTSLSLLFYSGFTCAVWRSKRNDSAGAS